MSKRPFSGTEKANVKRIRKDMIIYNIHDDMDDAQLLTPALN